MTQNQALENENQKKLEDLHKENLEFYATFKDVEKDRNLKLYSMFFDRWAKTSDERIETNKYFITLLFANTLVAVLGWVIGARELDNRASGFLNYLLVAVFLTGAVISLTWLSRTYPLNLRWRSQKKALLEMEKKGLLAFRGLEVEYVKQEEKVKNALIKWDNFNYYFLPLTLCVIFSVLTIAAALPLL